MTTPLERLLDTRRKAIFRVFEEKFQARVRVTVGSATCENAAGAGPVYDRIKALFGQHEVAGAVLGRVGCSGKCDMEPVVTVITQGETPVKYIKMTPEKIEEVFESHIMNGQIVHDYSLSQMSGLARPKRVVSLCGGPHCLKHGGLEVEKAFVQALRTHGLENEVALTKSSCHGLCEFGPIAFVYPDGVTYQKVTPDVAGRIVEEHLVGGQAVADHTWSGDRIVNRQEGVAVRARTVRAESGAQHGHEFPGRVRGAHPRAALSRGCLRGPGAVPDRPGEVCGLRRLPAQVSRAVH